MSVAISESLRADASTVCTVRELEHAYDERVALAGVNLETRRGEIVALLGKNGSGKSTLFRLLSTLMPIQKGSVTISGLDVATHPLAVRNRIGIVFQSASLDKKLTVDENIACQAALYGIRGQAFVTRRDDLLEQLELTERRHELCETLSGGLKRRVEIAKGLLHHPDLMLLDEPSTGLDPSSRLGLARSLRQMADSGVSVLMTTHLLEEADKADRVVILSDGKIACQGTPTELRRSLGTGLMTLVTSNAPAILQSLADEEHLHVAQMENQIRIRCENPAEWVPSLHERFGDQLESISIGRPSLEDVFIEHTGQSIGEIEP